MNVLLNKYTFLEEQHIKDMLGNFSKATGLYIEGIDINGKSIIKPTGIKRSEFCEYISVNDKCKKKCEESYKSACVESFKWKQPYFFRCHAGLVMWSVPMIKGMDNIGAIICGQVLLWKPDEFTYEEMFEFNSDIINKDVLKEKIDKLNIISTDKTQAVADMMSIFVNYIININTESITEQNRKKEWKNKMSKEFAHRNNDNLNVYLVYDRYFKKEKKILQHIRMGDKEKILELLPNIFTEILVLSNYEMSVVRIRCIELLSLISRALVEGGLDSQLAIDSLQNCHITINEAKDMDTLFSKIEIEIVNLLDLIYILSEDRHISLLQKARQFILENYSKDIIIEDVAEHVLISASYLSSLFKSKLNYTVNEYISRVRVEEAIEQMKSREISIQAIAHNVGFNSSSHFTKVFKKYIGVTPIHYRNKFL